jgi:hypothetical protein
MRMPSVLKVDVTVSRRFTMVVVESNYLKQSWLIFKRDHFFW